MMRQLLSDDYGNPSTMRLLVAVIVLAQMAGWLYVCLKSGVLPPMQWEQVGLVVGALGAKAHQKGKEGECAEEA